MIISVPTVQHTGSFFVAKHLLSGYEKKPIKTKEITDGVYFDHIWPHKKDAWKRVLDASDIVVVPLRHPALVSESWKRRNRPFNEMRDQWYMLRDFIDQYKPLYLPLDVKNRDKYLLSLSKALGKEIKTSWPVIHSKAGSHELDWETFYPDNKTQELVDELRPFISRFY